LQHQYSAELVLSDIRGMSAVVMPAVIVPMVAVVAVVAVVIVAG